MLRDFFNSAGKDVPTETLAKAATAHWKLLSPVERSAFHPSFRKLNPQAPEVTPVLKKRLLRP
ncbi:hypothetical protein DIPPA_13101 [Diplonema papillatum]|nr:hypothetical protein DIPPA_13101 [Diplonema papillatum]